MSFAHQSGAGGVSDHGLLTGLLDDDHIQNALLAGRAAGQVLIGGQAASENLTLQSTAHATRGYVRAQDDLQLLSGILRDSGGTNRLQLATASPHLSLTGDLKVDGWVALAGGTPTANRYLDISPSFITWTSSAYLMTMNPVSCHLGVGGSFIGIQASAAVACDAGSTPLVRGLQFVGFVAGAGNPSEVSGVTAQVGCSNLTGTITDLHALHAVARYMTFGAGGGITRSHGLRIQNQGKAGVGTTFGLLIEPQLNSTACYSIWAGAAYSGTPRLRLDEGTPGPGQTMLNLAEGATPTLRRVQWMDPGAGGANFAGGERVMILV